MTDLANVNITACAHCGLPALVGRDATIWMCTGCHSPVCSGCNRHNCPKWRKSVEEALIAFEKVANAFAFSDASNAEYDNARAALLAALLAAIAAEKAKARRGARAKKGD